MKILKLKYGYGPALWHSFPLSLFVLPDQLPMQLAVGANERKHFFIISILLKGRRPTKNLKRSTQEAK